MPNSIVENLRTELMALTDDQLFERGQAWLRQQQEKGMVGLHLSTTAGPSVSGGREVLIDLLCAEAAIEAGEVIEWPVAASEIPPHILETIMSLRFEPRELLNPFSDVRQDLTEKQISSIISPWLRRQVHEGNVSGVMELTLSKQGPQGESVAAMISRLERQLGK